MKNEYHPILNQNIKASLSTFNHTLRDVLLQAISQLPEYSD